MQAVSLPRCFATRWSLGDPTWHSSSSSSSIHPSQSAFSSSSFHPLSNMRAGVYHSQRPTTSAVSVTSTRTNPSRLGLRSLRIPVLRVEEDLHSHRSLPLLERRLHGSLRGNLRLSTCKAKMTGGDNSESFQWPASSGEFGHVRRSLLKTSRKQIAPSPSCSHSDDLEAAAPSSVESSVNDKALLSPGGNAVYPAVAVACLGAFLFGYHLGVVNGALIYISKDLGILKNAVAQGWVVSATLAGATIGSFTGGSLADKLGRTRTFQVDVIPLVVGTLLSANANVVQSMIIGRFLVGIGIGLTSAVVPLYISEIAPTDIRGTLGTVNQLCICIGILAALVAGLPLAQNPLWWRSMFAIAAVPAVALAFGMAFAPESPRWLYQQGKMKEAESSVIRLWGRSRASVAMAELKQSAVSTAGEEEAGWMDLFGKRYRKVVAIGAAMFFFQQFAGINAVVYYSSAVFRKVGIVSDVAASALVGATNVIGTLIASALMDKQGRKKLVIGSFAGMALSMLILSLSLSWKALESYSGFLAVAGTMAYVLAFSLGVGPVPALLLPEIFANRIRAKAVALSLGMHWVCNFAIGLTFLRIVDSIGVSSVYLGFASVCLLAILFVDRFVIETKGRSLEEIEKMLAVSS